VRNGYSSASVADCLAVLRGEERPGRRVAITFDDAYASLEANAFSLLAERGLSAIVFVVTQRVGQENTWEDGGHVPLLSAERIRHWAGAGIEFGSHTRTHANLTLIGGDELEDEIAGSRTDLEQLLERPVETFAYPYGYVSPAARELAAGRYPLAFSTLEGLNRRGTDAAMARRCMVLPGDSTLDLALMLRFGSNYRARVRKRAGRLRRLLARG
jgi:peptidoglycan/xylan/chitin deacetylase (PgdA/CDA1 family)